MIRYDNENLIMEDVIDFCKEAVHLVTGSPFEKELFHKIRDNWQDWIINNSKQSLPPDYYSKKYNLMFDVFRINDSEHNRHYSPVITKGKQIEKEFMQQMKIPSNAELVSFIITRPESPIDDIHNYKKYIKMVRRVISNHIDKINLCKQQHPDFKMGFLICDETDIYVERLFYIGDKKGNRRRLSLHRRIHFHFYNKNLMDQLIANDVDFVIWFTPYKFRESRKLSLPRVHIIDIKNYTKNDYADYDEDKLYIL